MRCWTSQDECRCTHAAAAFSFAPSVPFPLSFARSVLLFCFVRQDCYTSTLSPRSAATPDTRLVPWPQACTQLPSRMSALGWSV